MRSLGLDIGNGFASVALLDDSGRVLRCFAPNLYFEGESWGGAGMPTEAYIAADGTVLVGESNVANLCNREPWRAERAIKRKLLEERIQLKHNGNPVLDDQGKPQSVSPGQVYSAIVERVVSLANQYLEDHGYDPAYDVVLAYPASYRRDPESGDAGSDRLRIMRQAAEQVTHGGEHLHVVRMVPEPAAAARDYLSLPGVPDLQKGEGIIVYDLGYGTFDIALVTPAEDEAILTVADFDGIDDLGCMDFDECLNKLIEAKLRREHGFIPKSDFDLEELRSGTLEVKYALSEYDEATYHGRTGDGRPIELSVSRSEFEARSKYLLKQTVRKLDAMLRTAVDKGVDVKFVVLAGGGSHMPMVERAVRDCVETAHGSSVVVKRHPRPSDAVAFGAARDGAPIGTAQPMPISVSTTCAYGIENERTHDIVLVVPSGVELPYTAKRCYQSRGHFLGLWIYRTQGAHPTLGTVNARECVPVRHIVFPVQPRTPYDVQFQVRDDDGSISVRCIAPDGTFVQKNTNDFGPDNATGERHV